MQNNFLISKTNEKKVLLSAVILSLPSSIVGLVQISVLQMAMITLHREKRRKYQRHPRLKLFSYIGCPKMAYAHQKETT